MTATKEATERALEGAVHEVIDLAKELGVDAITLYAKANGFGNACAFLEGETKETYARFMTYGEAV